MNQTTIVTSLIDAILRRGTGADVNPAAATTLVDTVENVTLKITMDEAPANNRRSKIKQSVPTLAGVELEINFPADSADPHLAAFKSACINRTAIAVYCTDGAALAFRGLMGVFGLDNDQPLPNVPGYKFTLKPWAVGVNGTQPQLS